MSFTIYQNKLLYLIRRFVLDNGFAPQPHQLALMSGSNIEEVEHTLLVLEDAHTLTMNPNSFDIWSAPPFTLYPSTFLISTEEKIWWANCTWCAFGISVLADRDTQIFTRTAGSKELLTIHISEGQVMETNYVVHIPFSANLRSTEFSHCADIFTFEKESDVIAWCRQFNKPKGQLVPLKKLWSVSKQWYSYYMNIEVEQTDKDRMSILDQLMN
jgi:hypothetical protein